MTGTTPQSRRVPRLIGARLPLWLAWGALVAFLLLPLGAMLLESVWTSVDNPQRGGVVAAVAGDGRSLQLEEGSLRARLDQPTYRNGRVWAVVDGMNQGDGIPLDRVEVQLGEPGPDGVPTAKGITLWFPDAVNSTDPALGLTVGAEVALAPGSYWSLDGWANLLARRAEWVQMGRSLAAGCLAALVAVLLGLSHTWVTWRTDLPGGAWLGPMAVAPLVIPPIVLAMSLTELVHPDDAWVPLGGILMGISTAPFVAVLTARGLRAVDGRIYEAAVLCRGRFAAGRLLGRLILPEIAAGALFAFLLTVAEHGVMEFLSVLQENRLTYAEGVFGRWNLRTSLGTHRAISAATVGAVPLVAITMTALWLALRFRSHSSGASDHRPLPTRPLGVWRWPALLIPGTYLTLAMAIPIGVMTWWAGGGTRLAGATNPPELLDRMELTGAAREAASPTGLDWFAYSLERCFRLMGDDLGNSLLLAALVTLFIVLVATPLSASAWRGRRMPELLPTVAMGVPAILLGIGMVKVYNQPATVAFYDGPGAAVCGFGIRFLPFAVLALAGAMRRLPGSMFDAARLTGRGPVRCFLGIHLPLWLPAIWAAGCLVFALALRELDLAVVLPGGNDTAVRRLSNIIHFGGEEEGGALALLLFTLGALPPVVTMLLTNQRMRSLS